MDSRESTEEVIFLLKEDIVSRMLAGTYGAREEIGRVGNERVKTRPMVIKPVASEALGYERTVSLRNLRNSRKSGRERDESG